MKRRKLFSSTPATKVRRRLFSEPTITAKCHDCGTEIVTADGTTSEFCPKCGGKRFDVPSKVSDKEFSSTIPSRRKLFTNSVAAESFSSEEKKFSESEGSEFTNLLKSWQGKEMSSEYCERIFSGHDLVSEGLAETIEEGKIKVFSMAEETEKLFSALKITVIKELLLDPIPCPNPSPVIESLAVEKSVPAKTIVLMKKAHALPKENLFSETGGWIKDSGLKEDLEQEFGDKEFTLGELKTILGERYEDAPENTIEYLKESGIIEETTEGNYKIKK